MTRQRSGASILTGLAGCLGGGADRTSKDDWPMYGFDPANTGYTPARGPSEPAERWTREIGMVRGAPVVGHDAVYVGSASGVLHAMDPETGADRWTADIDTPLYSTPAVDGNSVYVTARSVLVALDAAGEMRWSKTLPMPDEDDTACSKALVAPPAASSPTVVNDKVYVPTSFGMFAYDVEDGEELWTYDYSGGLTYPAILDGVVHTGAVALDAETGEPRWEASADFPALYFWGASATAGMVYCATSHHGKLLGVDAASGEIQWTSETLAFNHPPVLARGTVLVGVEPSIDVDLDYADETGSKIVTFDAQTGDPGWAFDRLGTDEVGTAVSVGDETVFARRHDGLYALDLETGGLRWELDAPLATPVARDSYHQTNGGFTQPTVVEGALFVGATVPGGGGVYAIGEA